MIKHIYLPVIPMRTLHASSFLSPPADSGMINQGDWASEILGHKDSFSSLAFSTDGQLLASGGFHGLVQNRDTSSGNLQCTVEGPRGGIEDSTVWMWNADRGAYLNMFSGHGSGLTCGDFTTDGKTICTGSDNATLSIWNPKGGENFHVIRRWSDLLELAWHIKVSSHRLCRWKSRSLSVSAIRESLVSVSVDGTARVFEIAEFRLQKERERYILRYAFQIRVYYPNWYQEPDKTLILFGVLYGVG
ncbi:hypothetical protein CUMW_045800 [Citrus unshiu]|nr:hypothetical protein CUMW_045800 [Citrus unshiu]